MASTARNHEKGKDWQASLSVLVGKDRAGRVAEFIKRRERSYQQARGLAHDWLTYGEKRAELMVERGKKFLKLK